MFRLTGPLVVGQSRQAGRVVQHHGLRDEEPVPEGHFNHGGGALEALVRVLVEDGGVVAHRVLAALHNDLHDGDQLRVEVPTVVGVVRGLD